MRLIIDRVDELAGSFLIVKSERQPLRVLKEIGAQIEDHLLLKGRRHIAVENVEHVLRGYDDQPGEHGKSEHRKFSSAQSVQRVHNRLKNRTDGLMAEHAVDNYFQRPWGEQRGRRRENRQDGGNRGELPIRTQIGKNPRKIFHAETAPIARNLPKSDKPEKSVQV